MGWRVRLDVDKDDGTEPPRRWTAVLGFIVVTAWIVLVAVVVSWLESVLGFR